MDKEQEIEAQEPEGQEPEVQEEKLDFSELLDDFETKEEPVAPSEEAGEEPPEEVTETPVETPVEPSAPEASAEPPTEEPPPAEPPVTPPEQPPQTGEQPQQPQPKVPTPEEINQVREQMRAEIAANYSLSDEQLSEMEENPKEFWPKTIATLFTDVYEAVYGVVQSQIPQMVQTQLRQTAVHQTLAQQFYDRWPSLKDAKFGPQISMAARTFAQQNPKGTRQDAIEFVGSVVSAMNKLPVGPPTPPEEPPPPQPAAPRAGFRPPVPGASRGPAKGKPAGPSNVFEEMATWEEDF